MASVFSALILALPLACLPKVAVAGSGAGTVFAERCASCHGPDGAGFETTPDIRGVPLNVLRRALTGADGMPEFDFESAEIAALHAYLGALSD